MRVEVTGDPVAFRDRVFGFLRRDPVLNTIVLTAVETAVAGRRARAEPGLFATVLDGSDRVAGVAMRTPPWPVFLGALADEFVVPVAETFARLVPEAAGVQGTPSGALLFAERWKTLLTKGFRETSAVRLCRLGRLVDRPAPGRARPATIDDGELCVRWGAAFGAEITEPAAMPESRVVDRIAAGALWLWEDGGVPACLVGHQVPVFGVTRIGPVYTPPEFRGRGYGSALTAYVSGRIRDSGSEACLHTDLANPTSNRIYAAIGYRPVADFVRLSFA